MIIIENKPFNLEERRRLLIKRKKRRKAIYRLSVISIVLFTSLLTIIFAMKASDKTVAKFILTAPKANKSDDFIVCIDPGHGDWDIGAEGASGSKEKDIVLKVGLKLGELLDKNENIKVIYTRSTDSVPWVETANDSLKERLKLSKISKADLFISIHCNTNTNNADAKGIETWYNPSSSESQHFASMVQNQLANVNYTFDRGLKYYEEGDELAVLELNDSVAALVELGFLSNIDDEKYLNSDIGQSKCAEALYSSILQYLEELKY